MTQPRINGIIVIDSIDAPGHWNPWRTVGALREVAAELGLKIFSFSNVKDISVKREDLENPKDPTKKVQVRDWPEVVQVKSGMHSHQMVHVVASAMNVKWNRCIYIANRQPTRNIARLDGVSKRGARALSIASYDSKNNNMPSCMLFQVGDPSEFPHSDALPASHALPLIMKAWDAPPQARMMIPWMLASPQVLSRMSPSAIAPQGVTVGPSPGFQGPGFAS